MDYWKECIAEALDDAGVTATDDQIDNIASWVAGAHDNYGMAFGHDCIPNPTELENKSIKAELLKEKSKINCMECNSRGYTQSDGPCHSSTSTCWKCKGEGRHLP